MSEWISVDTALPKESCEVFVYANDITRSWVSRINVYVCPEYGNVIFTDNDDEEYTPVITHWQKVKLPEPPKP